jgi:thiamine-monophosphate kinase
LSSRGNAGDTPGERAIVAHIRRRLPVPPSSLIVAVGDDAAVAMPGRGALQVLTTDALVEGVHFERRFSSLADVGYKAIAVNASDVAAMGGSPTFALLSLMLPVGTVMAQIDALLDGALEMAAVARLHIVGGNVTRSPGPLVVDVALTGDVRPRRILARGGGRPGDALYVTGTIGAATAGLDWLRTASETGPVTDAPADDTAKDHISDCVQRHRRPQPRLRIGALLGRTRAASACIDLSDGLADGVTQIAEASGTGAVIDAAALPIHPAAHSWFSARGQDAVTCALSGGDDYELLFSVKPKSAGRLRGVVREARAVPVTRIGELTRDRSIVLNRDGRLESLPPGFAHFW